MKLAAVYLKEADGQAETVLFSSPKTEVAQRYRDHIQSVVLSLHNAGYLDSEQVDIIMASLSLKELRG